MIERFLKDVQTGPVFVCTLCHRLMYKEGVVKVQVAKYKKASSDLLPASRDDA